MSYRHQTTSLIPELACSSIKMSLSFYIEILGFRIEYQREEEGFAMLERDGARIMLDEINFSQEAEAKRSWVSAPLEIPFGRGINLEIKTKRVNELYDWCQEKGATIFLPIEDKWYRAEDIEIVNRQFILLDPDGYMLRFSENMGERQYKSL